MVSFCRFLLSELTHDWFGRSGSGDWSAFGWTGLGAVGWGDGLLLTAGLGSGFGGEAGWPGLFFSRLINESMSSKFSELNSEFETLFETSVGSGTQPSGA